MPHPGDPTVLEHPPVSQRYQIERELGRGGMAVVYLARDRKHDRPVAIKLVRPEIMLGQAAERFLLEIRILSRLQHPNILALLDSGATDEPSPRPYYVMPFIEGETLRQRLAREGPLPMADALRLAREIGEALHYAHENGLIHRDVKPENVLLSQGHALVADFGIARAAGVAAGDRLTKTGLGLGTPAYMSPEQAGGERGVDARADQYSLACLVYELLAGQPPFTGPDAIAVLSRQLLDPVPPLTTLRPTVPVSVRRAIERALAKMPVDRYESVMEFLAALEAPDAAAAAPTTRQAIVVLPFANLSPDPDNAYFADGLTEEVIADLSRVRSLTVISRTSSAKLKETGWDLRRIGRELNVGYALEGSVRRAGSALRITAQLIDLATETDLWARSTPAPWTTYSTCRSGCRARSSKRSGSRCLPPKIARSLSGRSPTSVPSSTTSARVRNTTGTPPRECWPPGRWPSTGSRSSGPTRRSTGCWARSTPGRRPFWAGRRRPPCARRRSVPGGPSS